MIVAVETTASATVDFRSTSWLLVLNISTQELACFDAITWFALPPIEPRLTQASIENRSPTFREESLATCTQPLVPLKATAVSGSFAIAPGCPRVVPL